MQVYIVSRVLLPVTLPMSFGKRYDLFLQYTAGVSLKLVRRPVICVNLKCAIDLAIHGMNTQGLNR